MRQGKLKQLGWWTLFISALTMAVYALLNVLLGEQVWAGVLQDSFRARPWGIYSHALLALFGMVLGPIQFVGRIRRRHPGVIP
jgi:hypothetical protein